jgi:hypothetical protein
MPQEEQVHNFVADAADFKQALLKAKEKFFNGAADILRFQFTAPNRTVTVTEIAAHMKYKDWHAANLWYGKLGQLIAEALNYAPAKRAKGKAKFWSTISTGGGPQEDTEHFQFVMRPEFAQAIMDLGWWKNAAPRTEQPAG